MEPLLYIAFGSLLIDLEWHDIIRLEFSRHSSRDKSRRTAERTHRRHRILISDQSGTAAVTHDLMTLSVVFRDLVVTRIIVLYAAADRTQLLECRGLIDITAVAAYHALYLRREKEIRCA